MPAPSTPAEQSALERRILGAALYDDTAASLVSASAPPDRFVHPAHRAIAEAVVRLTSEGNRVGAATVVALGCDPAAVEACATGRATPADVPFLCAVLAEGYLSREGERFLLGARARLGSGDDVFEVFEDVQRRLSTLQFEATRSAHGDSHIRHAVAEALLRSEEWRQGKATDYASSGFYALDRVIGGFPVGELTTLAAMTGAGKTSLLCQAVGAVAQTEAHTERPAPVVVFSAEMSREQLAHRVAAQLARTNLRDLRTGAARPEEYDRHDAALSMLTRLELHVDDEPAPTFAHIAARLQLIRQTNRQADGRLAMIAVDYDEKIDAQAKSEELRVSAISRGLKGVAKRFATPVLGLSQYSRSANPREAPMDDWLRYSGKKEHESAMIVHWHSPGYWVSKGVSPDEVYGYDEARPARGYLIVTKNRFGPLGTIAMDFDPATTSFTDPSLPR